jgi:hypothetical protein
MKHIKVFESFRGGYRANLFTIKNEYERSLKNLKKTYSDLIEDLFIEFSDITNSFETNWSDDENLYFKFEISEFNNEIINKLIYCIKRVFKRVEILPFQVQLNWGHEHKLFSPEGNVKDFFDLLKNWMIEKMTMWMDDVNTEKYSHDQLSQITFYITYYMSQDILYQT